MSGNFLEYQLYACGRGKLPKQVNLDECSYVLSRMLKHDFFAATALYHKNGSLNCNGQYPNKIVLKMHRQTNLLGIPMRWLGRITCQNELDNLKRLSSLRQVPRLITQYRPTGFVYEYIEGKTLEAADTIPDDFFEQLGQLLNKVHDRGVVYLDLNKRGNIILGTDNKPYLIDFQISLKLNKKKPRENSLVRNLKFADFYHIYKHKRKLRPDLLTTEEKEQFSRISPLIGLHRMIANPIKKLRRKILKFLYSKKLLAIDKNIQYSQEDNPYKYLK